MGGDPEGRANFGESRGKDSVSPTLAGVFLFVYSLRIEANYVPLTSEYK